MACQRVVGYHGVALLFVFGDVGRPGKGLATHKGNRTKYADWMSANSDVAVSAKDLCWSWAGLRLINDPPGAVR